MKFHVDGEFKKILGINPVMNAHSYDLEKEAVEVQWILSVIPNSFLHFALGTTELLYAFDSLRQPGFPPFPPFISILLFCFGINVLDFLELEYQLYLLCVKKLFLSYSY